MRVAYLTSEYPGLSHTFIAREVAALRKRGVEITTFSVRRPPARHVKTEADRKEQEETTYLRPVSPFRLVGVHAAAFFTRPLGYLGLIRRTLRRRTAGLRGLAKWAGYFGQAVVLAKELRRRKVTHLHNHFANASANVAMLAAEFARIPWSFTLHGIYELEWDGVGKLSDKVASAAFAVCVCDFNRAQAMRMSPPAQWGKLHVVRCGLDLSVIPFRPRPDTAGRPLRILTVARFSPEKGLIGLLTAFDQVIREGIDAELVLVGDGPQKGDIEAEVARLGLGGRCHLVGPKFGQETLDELDRADVFVMSSFIEGLPVAIMEAMASGAPVVAPIISGIPELIPAEWGTLYPASRWGLLADRLVRLARDPALRKSLAERGRAAVESEHVIDRNVVPLADLFGGSRSVATEF